MTQFSCLVIFESVMINRDALYLIFSQMHEFVVEINKNSVPWITVCYHHAYQVMTNGDPVRRTFLSHLHTNNEFFFWFKLYFFV